MREGRLVNASRIIQDPNRSFEGYKRKTGMRCPDCGGRLDFESFGLLYCWDCGGEYVRQVVRGGKKRYLLRVPA